MRRLAIILFALVLMTRALSGQQQPVVTRTRIPPKPVEAPDYENWQVELTGEYWALKPSGSVMTDSSPENMKDDLGIEGWKSHPAASAVVQFSRRNKIVIEGIKYRLNGGSVLNRELVFHGQSFSVSDQIKSTT